MRYLSRIHLTRRAFFSFCMGIVFLLTLLPLGWCDDTMLSQQNSEETSGIENLLAPNGSKNLTPDLSETIRPDDNVFQAGISHLAVETPKLSTCEKGQADCFRLKVRLLDFAASGYSATGDIVEAIVLEETHTHKNVLIPKGAKLTGIVEESLLDTHNQAAPTAILSLKFDSLLIPSEVTPVPMQAHWRKEVHLMNVIGRGIERGLAGGSVGALKGALVGLSSGGLGMAILSNGTSLISASGVGALMGIHKGLSDTSAAIILNEGQTLTLSLGPIPGKETLLLSATPAVTATSHSQNLNVYVQQAKLSADPFDTQNQLTVTFDVTNVTSKDLSAMNMAVVDAYGKRYFLSPFAANDAYKTVFKANQKTHASLTFTIKNALEGYYLVLYNPAHPNEVMVKTGIPKAS